MVKKILSLIVSIFLICSFAFAKEETNSPYAGSQVIYGYDGSVIQRIKTNSSGELLTNSASALTLVRKESSQDLSAGALSYTTNFSAKTRIKQIFLHASVAISETVKVTFDSKTSANYDTVIASRDLTSAQDYVYIPDGDLVLENGDELVISCTNANTTGTVYVTVIGETLS